MTLVEGVLLAISGNFCSGVSQVLQKRALSRLQRQQPSSPVKRYLDQEWILGIGLGYLGDATNFLAFSKANPAILAPLGIISIFTALLLAKVLLREEIGKNQRRGYGIALFGVLFIMLAAPKKDRNLGDSTADLFKYLLSWHFLRGLSALLIAQFFLIIIAFRARKAAVVVLSLYVSICSFFAALTISLGKVVAQFLISLTFRGSERASSFIGPQLKDPSSLEYLAFLTIISLTLITCSISQEYFKQQCLDNFSVSRFFPLFYAGLNCSVILSSVYFWSRFETDREFQFFCFLFSISMSLIVAGISMVQKEDYVYVKTPFSDKQDLKQ
jgi:hypothetical protein